MKKNNQGVDGILTYTPFVFLILDGWGCAPAWGGNAISVAKTKNFDKIWREYPKTTILASGQAVGLPEGAPGNSEAGHLNIGAGKIVHQDLPVIDEKINRDTFFENKTMLNCVDHANKYQSNYHILGLLSKTGTHSHIKHLYSILEFLKVNGAKNAYIHLFSDGRDSDPMSGVEMIDEVERKIEEIELGTISSIMGRYYAMDRDNRWGRTARAYNALVNGEVEHSSSPERIFAQSYSKHITDEFILPTAITNKSQSMVDISDNDVVILFNFRSDRTKQLSKSFVDKNEIKEFSDRVILNNLKFISFVTYEGEEYGDQVFFPDPVDFPIARVFSEKNLKQYHIAETEKYAHVTYFINGGIKKPFQGEERKLIPSPREKTYDIVPEMSAEELSKVLIKEIKRDKNHFYIVNYANPDMVGHTGNLKSTVRAVSFVDKCLEVVCEEVLNKSGTVFVFADHGNAEQMIHVESGEPHTEHTTNPVPFIVVNKKLKGKITLQKNGALSNIAPTALDILGISPPEEMSSKSSLIIKENQIKKQIKNSYNFTSCDYKSDD